MTGFGADYLLIDDPVSPQEAMSDTIRQSTNSEIRSTLFSRFNDYDKGRLVMIMQRLRGGPDWRASGSGRNIIISSCLRRRFGLCGSALAESRGLWSRASY